MLTDHFLWESNLSTGSNLYHDSFRWHLKFVQLLRGVYIYFLTKVIIYAIIPSQNIHREIKIMCQKLDNLHIYDFTYIWNFIKILVCMNSKYTVYWVPVTRLGLHEIIFCTSAPWCYCIKSSWFMLSDLSYFNDIYMNSLLVIASN